MNALDPALVTHWLTVQRIPMDGKTRAEVYQWNLPGGKTHWYSIDAAQYGIAYLRLPVHQMPPEDVDFLLSRNQHAPDPNSPAVDAADLTQPLILGTMDSPGEGRRNVLIDGWHRVAKAAKIKHTQPLPVYVLPYALTEACLIAITQEAA